MDMMDWFRALTSGQDPNQAIVPSAFADPSQTQLPPPVANAQAAMPPIPQSTAPQGVRTPVTNPQPAADTPKITQSPPDLANMYVQLMQKNQNAAAMDQGMTLVAAGLTQNQATRQSLIQAASSGGNRGTTMTSQDLINLQKAQVEQQQRLMRQSLLGGLMKQYKMTPEQIQYLESSGKLDEVLKHYSTENLAQVKDESGVTHMVTPRDGKVVTTIGSEKKEGTQFVAGPEGQELRSTETGQRIGAPVGLAPKITFKDTPSGTTALDENTGKVIATAIGGAPTPETEKFERKDGSQFLRDKRSGVITEITPAAKPGDVIPAQENELFAINKARETRGEKPLTAEELIKLKQSPGVQVNVSPSGATFPEPEHGYAYLRDPKDPSKVAVDAEGKPKLYKIEGGKPAEAATKLTEKEAKAKVHESFASSNVGKAIDEALSHVDTPGVVGIGSKTVRGIPSPGGLPHDKFDAAMDTVRSNITIQTLAQMRAASPTGGALGNVSDFEDKMLGSTIAPLATYQDAKTMRAGLVRVKAAMELLANDDFNKDPAKFQAALAAREKELLPADTPKVKRLR